jgi:uncharacterized glyoxalase superfamily protein PhnB
MIPTLYFLSTTIAPPALEFYKKVFGATELFRFDGPGGTVAHAASLRGRATSAL